MSNKYSVTAKRLSLSGMLLALTVISLFAATIAPTNRLSLYTLSSFFVAVIVIEFGIKAGWVFYLASSLLSVVIIPNKVEIIPFVIFFGFYGIVKYYIEKLNKLMVEYVIKYIYFNLCLITAVLLVKEFLLAHIQVQFPWWVLILGVEVAFLVYDYVYTLFIQYYRNKLKKMLKI